MITPSEMVEYLARNRSQYVLLRRNKIDKVEYPYLKQVLFERWLSENTQYDEWDRKV